MRYQRRRLGDNALAARGFELLHDLYLADTTLWSRLRDFGVGMIDRSGMLKRELALAACGYGGEVPALSRRLEPSGA
jgi:2-polyprenyl-6-methoxyphenol hydroxylase-like FAD-dependent oxidoreductase